MSEAEVKPEEITEEVLLSKASELIVKLRELEQRAQTEDLKKVWQELRAIIGEARKYHLEKSLTPLVRKIKAIIRRRHAKMMKEKAKAQQQAQAKS